MGRIEYWLLGVVGALIAFIAVESVKSTLEPRRYALQIEQAGHPRDMPLDSSGADSASAAPVTAPTTFDVHSAVRNSRAPAPARNAAEVRRRINDGVQRTYILDILSSQD